MDKTNSVFILCLSTIVLVLIFAKLSQSPLSFSLMQKYDERINTQIGRKLVEKQAMPDGLRFQSRDEKDFLTLHKCREAGEAYAAAYLTTREHFLEHFTGYNLTWVNCEMASFIMITSIRGDLNREKNGTIMQSLDVLDYSVIHLSAYERLQRKFAKQLRNNYDKTIDPVIATGKLLKTRALEIRNAKNTMIESPDEKDLNRTVAVMPFLGADMGSGHSVLSNRYHYLHPCFWSVYAEFPHVVVAVKNQVDYDYAKSESGLPFFDVLLIKDLPKSASLPVATVQTTKELLRDGNRWSTLFDYVYFTESDQIILLRSPYILMNVLKKHPRRVVVPHRLMPFPKEILQIHNVPFYDEFNKTTIVGSKPYVLPPSPSSTLPMPGVRPYPPSTILKHRTLVESTAVSTAVTSTPRWLDYSCCMPRQNCDNRKTWKKFDDKSISSVTIYGLHLLLGNIDFHKLQMRGCTMDRSQRVPYCP